MASDHSFVRIHRAPIAIGLVLLLAAPLFHFIAVPKPVVVCLIGGMLGMILCGLGTVADYGSYSQSGKPQHQVEGQGLLVSLCFGLAIAALSLAFVGTPIVGTPSGIAPADVEKAGNN